MQTKLLLMSSAVALAMLGACSGRSDKDAADVARFDMVADIGKPDFDETKIVDAAYTLLDTCTEALLGERPTIMGVIGDTIIVHDMNRMGDGSHLALFDMNDGHLIRSISHIGNGPGEYRWIQGLVTDSARNQLTLIADGAHTWTTDDRYIESHPLARGHGGPLPYGSARRGIHQIDGFDGNMNIYQSDIDFTRTDTIVIPDYEPKWISVCVSPSADEVLVNVVDTVYSLYPGGMEPKFILSRGDKALTPEVEKQVYIGRTDFEKAQRERQAYIEPMQFIDEGDRVHVTYSYGGKTLRDIYSRSQGRLIARKTLMDENYQRHGLEIPVGDATFHVALPFYWGGRFYAIVEEEETLGPDGQPSDDLNRAIISWRLE